MPRRARLRCSSARPWSHRALASVLAFVLGLSVISTVTLAEEAAAGPNDLLLVTTDGLATGRNADLSTLFQGFGWTVTPIDDDTAPATLIAAAESSGVVYLTSGTGQASVELATASVPVVSEEVNGWGFLQRPGGGAGTSSGITGTFTDINIVDDSHPITAPFGLGAEPLFSPGSDWTTWRAAVGAGTRVLGTQPGNTSRFALFTAETDSVMLSGTAPHRRVFFGVKNVPVSQWNATMEAAMDRSLDWAAAGSPAGSPPSSPIGDLVMVTGTGGFGGNADSAKRDLFESFGWTVTAIDDDAAAGALTAAAAAADVVFVADTVSNTAGAAVRDLDVGLVNEDYWVWSSLLNAPADDQDYTAGTQLNIVDTSHPITAGFSTGNTVMHSAVADFNFWNSSATVLPSAVDVLVELPGSPSSDALLVAESGAALLDSYAAVNRRVWFPSDFSDPAIWTADYETLLERSLLWAGSMSAAPTDADGDGLLDSEEDANTDADNDPATNPGPNTDGDTLPNYLDADDDGDTIPTASENADPNSDGDPRDARDSDRDGQPDFLDLPTSPSDGTVAAEQKISSTQGGLVGPLDDFDQFGTAVVSVGDVDGDGIVDIAAGANADGDDGAGRGAVYVLFLNPDGTVKGEQKISSASGGLSGPLDDSDFFGSAVAGLGDLDGDGIPDLAVGAWGDDDGGTGLGAVYVLFLNPDGTVKGEQKISSATGGLSGPLDNSDFFGISAAGLGDLDGDGIPDLAVGAWGDDDGGSQRGAVYVLFLNPDGTVKAEQKISSATGGLSGPLDNADFFGSAAAGLGDLDGDGTTDLAVGARLDDDGGSNRGAAYVLFLNPDGTVKGEQKISSATGGLSGPLDNIDYFGRSAAGLGDLDGDGIPDLAVGARLDDDGGSNRGAAYVLFLNPDGTVKAEQKISSATGGLTGPLDNADFFGISAAGLGDLDGDGTTDLAVGAWGDDDGGTQRGAVYILDLLPVGCVGEDADGDGLWDCEEDANTDLDDNPATNPGPNTDGDANPNYLDADDDGDGTPTASENADPNGDGDPRDALDVDRDGQPDYLDVPTGASDGTVGEEQKISATAGGLIGPLDDNDEFASGVTSVGDVDGDGVVDVAVGTSGDDDGGAGRGAVYVLFLNADGSVRDEQKISSTTGGLSGSLGNSDFFGASVTGVGDLDGDGVPDLAVGAYLDGDGGTQRGAVYVLLLNTDGTVKDEQKISSTAGGLVGPLDDSDFFGRSVSGVGDVDGDGVSDLAVGADGDDDGGSGSGAVYVLLLNADGTVRAEQKISSTTGGLTGTPSNSDFFGRSVSGVGDVDGDGVPDLAVGADGDDDGGSGRGAVYVLLLNADGTVRAEQKISSLSGGLTGPLDDSDLFGRSVSGVGDLDDDGIPDLAVGARRDADGGTQRGAVYALFLNADGSVKAEQKISSLSGGLIGPLDDNDLFGGSVAGVGDLEGDGTINIAVGAGADDDGGSNRGAVYMLNLAVAHCGTVDTDGDGLWDCEEDANTDLDDDPATNPGPNTDGDAFPNYLDADDDGDGTPTASENADPNGDGDPRDARDSDWDGQADYLDTPTLPGSAVVLTEQKVSSSTGGLAGPLNNDDLFGGSVASIGDLDGDGIVDLAVGALRDDDGGNGHGAVYVLFMNADGTVRAEQKISSSSGGLVGPLGDSDQFGRALDGVGDVDGDGVPDLVVGVQEDDDGGLGRGAVYVLFLNGNGTVKAEQKISSLEGGLAASLDDDDFFGRSVSGLGDVDGDGIPDVAVTAHLDDDGGGNRGAAYVLFLNADGTVKAEQKISSTVGGLVGPLDDVDRFGRSVSSVGDLDGDGISDIAVGTQLDDDGGNARGAVYVLFLNADGTVKGEQKISSTVGGLVGPLDDSDQFGVSISGVGDVDGDGLPDIAVGVDGDDDGGADRGAAYVLFLNADGTVSTEQKISSTTGGLTGPLDDGDEFGVAVSGLGDLDGDGRIDLAIGAFFDDDDGADRGAVYIVNLSRYVLPLEVNSTGDAGDLAPGDGICDTGGVNAIGLDECTSRAAIEEANASGGGSVSFDVPFADAGQIGGVWTTTPATPFDDIVVSIVIDGSTQSGWTSSPVIQIDGTSAGLFADGLRLRTGSSGSEIRSLAMGNFDGHALDIRSDRNSIVGNHLGIDASGTSAAPTGEAVVSILDGDDNAIGGASTSARNIVGAGASGVTVESSDGTVVSGNFIGTDVSGTVGLSGVIADAVRVGNGSTNTQVGGPTAAEGNLIGSAGDDGIQIDGSATDGVTIQHNSIGVTFDGFSGFNIVDDGISLIGVESVSISDNVIGNVNSDAIRIGGTSTGIEIRANTIGSNSAQSIDHFVGASAINIADGSSALVVGGTGVGDGNDINMGPDPAAVISIGNALADDVAFLGNSVDSEFIVIDLGADGPTANDPLDADGGPNDLLNHPTLAITNSTGPGPFTVDLDVSLDVPAGDYRIEIFANDLPGYNGGGKAEQLVHAFTVAHPGGGEQTFATSFTNTSFSYLSVTATEEFGGGAFGSTSEMSPAGDVSPVFVVNSTGDAGDADEAIFACDTGALNSEGDTECTLRAALEQANRASTPVIEFAIPTSDPGYDTDDSWTISKNPAYPTVFSDGITIDGATQPGFDSTGPVVFIDSNLDGDNLFTIRADDVSIGLLGLLRPGDDGIQVRGDRTTLDGLWIGVDPSGLVVDTPGAGSEGVIVVSGTEGLVISNSRIAGFDAGVSSYTGTIDLTVSDTEIFDNRNAGIVMGVSGRLTALGNSIHDNGGLGIDLGLNDGIPLPNDVGDGDSGPNDLLNHPVLTNVSAGVGTVDVDYSIDVPAGTYRIEFFDSDRPDPTGFGEGQRFLSAESIVHPGGSASYTSTLIAGEGAVITAAATPDVGGGTFGGTSEFSNASLVGVVFVNSTGDSGDLATGDGVCDTGGINVDGFVECTLRAAIEEADASADVDLIHFQIPETDAGFVADSPDHWVISPGSALPVVVDASIDALTQPASGGAPIIQLDGSGADPTADGLLLGTGVTIRGLSLTAWHDGLTVSSDDVVVEASWFGVEPDGSIAANRSADAVAFGSAANVRFGGPSDVAGNVFAAGGAEDGLRLGDNASNVVVENNHFGVATDGITPLGSVVGELLIIGDDVSAVTVRGNQFAGSPDAAIVVLINADDVDIIGNIFGTDIAGTLDLGLFSAVYAETSGSFRFGGPGAGDGNIVRNADWQGVVLGAGHSGIASILGNSIADSAGLAFDIAADGPTPNDPGDTTPGPNGTLNYPEIVSVVGSGGFVTVRFELDVAAGSYRVEAFANPSGADLSGYGEGEVFVGAVTVTHSGGGAQVFEMDVSAAAGAPISLTTTVDAGGGVFGPTSEFSLNAVPVSAAVVEDISQRLTDLTAAGGLNPSVPATGIGGDGINIDGGAERLVGPPTDVTLMALTMSASVNLDAAGSDPRIISKGVGAGTVYELFVDDVTGEAVARVDVGGSLVEASGGSVPTGSWHQIVASWNGFVLTLLVDGVVVDTVGAVGVLAVDLGEPLVVGNNRLGTAGLNGTIDNVELQHRAVAAAEVLAQFRNSQSPSAFVTIGRAQTAAPAPWSTSAAQSRTGGNALAAPTTSPGADAWTTAIGVDEPGVELTAWWWVTDATATEVSAGTRTGSIATDQFDVAADGTGLDLGVLSGATRTSAATNATTLASGSWQQVVMSTDELGVTSFRLDGVTRLGPTSLSGLTSGSVGFRAADIDPGQEWFIDDVRLRRLVSDEPVTSLGPIERN